MRDHSIVARTERSVRNAGLVDIRGIVQIVHFYVLICVIIRGIHKAISVAIRNDFLKGLEFYRHIVLVGVSAFDARPVDIGGADLFHKRRSRVDLALLHGQDGQFDALLGQKVELVEVRRRCALGAQTDLRGQRHLLRRVAGQRAIDRRARTVDGDDRGIAAEEADRRFGVIKILILRAKIAQILADKARVRQEHIARDCILRNGFARGRVPQRVLRGQRGVQQLGIVHRRGLRGLDCQRMCIADRQVSSAAVRHRQFQGDLCITLRRCYGHLIGAVKRIADLADCEDGLVLARPRDLIHRVQIRTVVIIRLVRIDVLFERIPRKFVCQVVAAADFVGQSVQDCLAGRPQRGQRLCLVERKVEQTFRRLAGRGLVGKHKDRADSSARRCCYAVVVPLIFQCAVVGDADMVIAGMIVRSARLDADGHVGDSGGGQLGLKHGQRVRVCSVFGIIRAGNGCLCRIELGLGLFFLLRPLLLPDGVELDLLAIFAAFFLQVFVTIVPFTVDGIRISGFGSAGIECPAGALETFLHEGTFIQLDICVEVCPLVGHCTRAAIRLELDDILPVAPLGDQRHLSLALEIGRSCLAQRLAELVWFSLVLEIPTFKYLGIPIRR